MSDRTFAVDGVYDIPGLAEYLPTLRQPVFAHLLGDLTVLPEIVAAFGGLHDPDALAAVVQNPNAPIERLIVLAGLFPAAFCANPVFPLLLFERPGLPAEMPAYSLGRLLAYPELPSDFVAAVRAIAQPEMAQAAALHVQAGPSDRPWREELETVISQLPIIPEDDLLLVLILLDAVPNWFLPCLARGGESIQAALAGTPLVPPLQISQIAELDPATPHEILEHLSDSDSPHDRAAVARSRATPPAMLLQIKQKEDMLDVDYLVYQALASNPAAPAELFVSLAGDRTALATGVRRAIARNPQAPPEALELLLDEPYAADVRLALVAHPNLAPHLRGEMLENSLNQARFSGEPIYRMIALAHPTCSSTHLNRAISSFQWLERLAVALNPNTPSALVQHLSNDGNRLVRRAARAASKSEEV